MPDLPATQNRTLYKLSIDAMINQTKAAGIEGKHKNISTTTMVTLPLPDGTFQTFRIWESSLMEEGLARKFPEIKTYVIRAVNNLRLTGRMMVSPYEVSAFFADPVDGYEVFVRKVYKGREHTYMSYYGQDDPTQANEWQCGYEEEIETGKAKGNAAQEKAITFDPTGSNLYLFRLAITFQGATSEANGYTTKEEALAGIVSFLSEINTIYERDLSIRFVLPENEENIIFLDDATDPFTTNGGDLSIYENQVVQRQYLGTENYDLGLVFVIGGCCGARSRVCRDEDKEISMNKFRALKTTCHEIGHQFNADHTFANCNGNKAGGNEVGSGTTIMSYIGTCGPANVPNPGSITYFSAYSRNQIITYLNNTVTCGKPLATGNTAPTITVPADGFYLPISTPFVLIGTGSDAEGDPLTYSWEQNDLSSKALSLATVPVPADGDVPIQRHYNPVSTPERIIPALQELLSNTSIDAERLPTYTRGMKYALYARDNHPGAGGTAVTEISFNVDGTAGPFLITSQNSCTTWATGSTQTITWDVANTTNANVNVQNVNILLSLDGGYTWETTLVSNTPNDGTEDITVPTGVCSDGVRVKVEAVGNYFFDVNDANLSIDDGTTGPEVPMAVEFDGNGSQVEINTTAGNFGTGDFAVEMQVKTDAPGGYLVGKREICSTSNFWNVELNTNGEIVVALYEGSGGPNNTLVGTSNIADGNWHHIAVVRSAGEVKILVDGIEENSTTMAADINNSAMLKLGWSACNDLNPSAPGFMGEITDFRIWSDDITITAGEEDCPLVGTEPNLEVYYPMDLTLCSGCGASEDIVDASGNGNNGTLVGGADLIISSLDRAACTTCANGDITITTQPGNTSVADGATAAFSVVATGTNLTYQWAESTDDGTSFQYIDGANEASYSFTAESLDNDKQYVCYIVNGCDVQTTTPATLTVSCGTLTISAITGEATPCQNNYYSYYVTPNPEVVDWAWTAPAGWEVTNYDNMIFVKVGSGSGNISLTATDACGNTDAETFAVSPVLVEITTHPASQTVSEGAAVNLSVGLSSGGGATTYLWQESIDAGASFATISGADAATYNIAAASIEEDGRQYRCVVENACLRDTSDIATLNISCTTSAPLNTYDIQGSEVICGNAVLTYAIDPIPGADTYSWTLPAGWSGTSTTNSIVVTANGSGGTLSVSATNACGTSSASILDIVAGAGDCPRGLHFDGVNDYTTAAQNGQYLDGDMTVSLWVNPSTVNGLQSLIFNGTEFEIALRDGQVVYRHSIYGGNYSDSVDSTFLHTPLQVDQWQHIAIVRDVSERNFSLYLNGVLFETKQWGTNYPSTPDDNQDYPLIFGAGANGLITFFHGALDEIKIWQEARTASQVIEDLACSPAGTETNLLGYYSFEQGQANGNNTSITSFNNEASAYPDAVPVNLAMDGIASNIVDATKADGPFVDADGDGFGGAILWNCGAVGALAASNDDCDDTRASINPLATEICNNNLDDDCDGEVDEANLALNFDGSDDEVNLGTSLGNFGDGDFTIEAWIKTDEDNYIISKRGICGYDNFWNVNISPGTGVLGIEMIENGAGHNQSAVFGTTDVRDNSWHHFAITRKGIVLTMYLDGVQEATTSFSPATNINNNTPLIIGPNVCGGGARSFKGDIDELRIWNIARSVQDINAYKDAQVPSDAYGLQGYYDFDNTSAEANGENGGQTSLTDRTGNYDGVLNNFALTAGTTSNWIGNPGCDPCTVTASLSNDGPACPGDAVVFTALPSGETTYQFFLDANKNGLLDGGESVQTGTGNTYSVSTLNDLDEIGVIINGCALAYSSVAIQSCGGEFADDCINSGEVTAYAGMLGVSGNVDATGTDATFNNPFRLAIDANDNIYVAEYNGHTIRKIAPNGAVTTLAGASGQSGYVDATGAAARFYRPRGLDVDAAGNVYVADALNRLIRKITPAGEVTTLAGSQGNFGYADGTGSAALFATVSNVAVDATGNLFVVEWGNNAIRKVTPAGVVTTFVGSGTEAGNADGTGGAARFNSPQGLAFDASGNLYVADWNNYLIRKVTPAGEVTTVAGSGTEGVVDGAGAAASFRWPYDIAFDSNGDMYVADWMSVRKVTPAGEVTTIVPESAGYSGITGVTVDSNDNIYFVTNGGYVVWKIGNCPDDIGQLAIMRQNPAGESTNAAAVTFRVTFAEGVQNVDAADFSLSGTAAVGSLGTPTMVNSDPAVYDVPVTGLSSASGTLNLDIASGNDIQDLTANPLGSSPTIGVEQEYTLDNSAGGITSILRQFPTDAVTNADFLTFQITFDEGVQNVDVTDFILSGTAAGDGTINNVSQAGLDPAVYNISVSGVDNSNGTINLDIAAGNDLQDLAGNALGSSPAIGTEEEFTLDNAVPTVAISSTAGDPTSTSPIPVTVTFSEAVNDFVVGDLTIGNGAAANFSTADNTVFTFELSPAADGLVTVDINADVVTDEAGNGNTAATQFGITYTSPSSNPIVSILRHNPLQERTNQQSLTFRITFAEDVQNVDLSDFILEGGAGVDGNFFNLIAQSASVYDVVVQMPSEINGIVDLDIASGNDIQGLTGNPIGSNPGIDTEEQYIMDSDAPTVAISSTAGDPTGTSPIPVTVTFNEAVNDFVIGDLSISNGTPGNFSTADNITYTFDLTPIADGVVTVDVNADVATDEASNGNTAATQFSITYESGSGNDPGAALEFNNLSSEAVVVPETPSLDISSAITIEFWINLQSFTGYDVYAMKADAGGWTNGYGMVSSSGGNNLYFIPRGWGDIHVTGYTLPLNQWTHVAGTYDGATSTVYINGQVVSSRAMTGSIPLNDNPLGIGGDPGSSFYGIDGALDEMRIWNRALSAAEIQQNMNCEIPTSAANLVANYHFNQGVAGGDNTNPAINTLIDASGQGNNGTLNNFILTGTESNWIAPGGVISGSACSFTPMPEIAVLGGATPTTIADGDVSPTAVDGTDFGLISTNSITDKTFIIQNNGTETLNLTGTPIVELTGNTSGFFSVITQPAANSIVTGGSDLDFVVRYIPTADGTHSATVSIANDDPDEDPYTFVISATAGTGTSGAALAFNSQNQVVTVPDAASLDINSEITIELWCKPESVSGWDVFVMKAAGGSWAGGYVLSSYNGVLDFDPTGWTGPTSTNFHIPLNQWTHIAASYDGTTSKVYINGSLYATGTAFGSIPVNNYNLSIGGDLGYSSYSFDGQMDEVRVWNRVLSEAEIQSNMNCEIQTGVTGLVANYHFNEGIAGGDNTNPPVNTLPDDSGLGNNGTLRNFQLTGTETNWVAPGGVVSDVACDITPNPEMDVMGGSSLVSIVNGDNSPSGIDGTNFGTREENTTTDKTFTIRNIGGATLNLTGSPIVELIDNTSGFFSIQTQPAANAIASGGGNLTFVVRYAPTSLGTHTARVRIANDDSDEGPYTFTVYGAADVIEPGAALALNNRNSEFVVVPDDASLDIASAITIEFWINLDNYTGYDAYVMKANAGSWTNGYGMVSSGSGQQLYFIPQGWSNIHNTGYTLPLGQWTHVAGTYDGTTSKVYINGALVSTKSMSGPIPVNNIPLGIGGDVGVPYYGTDGRMDEVRIWNRALSLSEIQANMDCELPGGVANLVANYHFNQGIADGDNNNPLENILLDDSGLGNDGTLNNFLLMESESNWVAPGGVSSGVACNSASEPEIDILGGTPLASISNGDASPAAGDGTNFGIQLISSTTDRTFNIRNYGAGTLNLTGSPEVILTDNASGFFSIETQPVATSIASGGSDLNFVVRYAPTTLGAHTAIVSIANNDTDEAPYTFTVTGSTDTDAFVTTWEISGTTESERTIFIPTFGGGYSYDVNWGDGTSDPGQTGNATHVYDGPGQYTVTITGTFPSFYLNGQSNTPHQNHLKLRSVEQWGTGAWTSMASAFRGAANMVINATDSPDLSNVTDFTSTFSGTTNLGSPDLTTWDVTMATNMLGMFQLSGFNGNISNWNVSNVVNANGMFFGSQFNGNLSGWSPNSLVQMEYMFGNCSFNGDISGWNTANVELMTGVFYENTVFNQPIGDVGGWNVAKVKNMSSMFYRASAFNQPLNNWDVSNVTDFTGMFKDASSFNQPLDNWDPSSALKMVEMFIRATSFNQPIENWNTANVSSMQGMFYGATAFDQSLGGLDVTGLPPGTGLWPALTNCGMSTANYDATLIGWAAQSVQSGVQVGAHGLTYCAGKDARDELINTHGWTFIGDALDDTACSDLPFVTVWETTPSDPAVTIYTNPAYTYNYTIDWGDGTVETGQTGVVSHTYSNHATPHTVSITGNLPNVWLSGGPNGGLSGRYNAQKLLEVKQWGSIVWKDLSYAFYGAENMNITASDVPDLSQVTDMSFMFYIAQSLNTDLNNWNVSKVEDMSFMFGTATSFNGDISRWNVSNVQNMDNMFVYAFSFNQDISSWDVSNVENMAYMFHSATSFNQNISRWDVSNVSNMNGMFSYASSFDQSLANWTLASLGAAAIGGTGMLDYCGMSKDNYDATLNGWASKAASLQSGVQLGAFTLEYCAGKTARDQLINLKGWLIGGDTENCPSPILGDEEPSAENLAATPDPAIEVEEVLPVTLPPGGMKVYPNPARDRVSIAIGGPERPYEALEIYDQFGRKLWSQSLREYQPLVEISLDPRTFTPGLYIVTLRLDDEILTEKLVIVK